ncbi:MAG: ligand-binding sensor domain-containing protein, partial [Adhaeribacter sp.]
MNILFLGLFFLAGGRNLQAAGIPDIGVPYVQNFPKTLYQAGNKNWSVAQDSRGVMYFGNSGGLLAYDGRYWNLYRMPNKVIVRAVAAGKQGRIYCGGFGEFGYWAYNKAGKFAYHSLISLLPENQRPGDEIWKIYVMDDGRVLFQSFSSIFIYEKGRIEVLHAANPYLFLFKAGNKTFVEVIGQGLYELVGKEQRLLAGSKLLGSSGVHAILPFQKDKYLIGTAKNGLFVYDGNTIQAWHNQANDFLKEYQLNNGASIPGNLFAFGTILKGLVILDETGRIVQRITKAGGLQNNTVLSLYTDQDQNLWAGLDNGIDRVEMNSPLHFYFDKAGRFGTVYASIVHGGRLYLGTNQGLFYLDLSQPASGLAVPDFKLVPGSQGQVWDLTLVDGQLLCGHNEGTFRVMGEQMTRISDVKGGWVIKKMPGKPILLLQGTYTGLVVYRRDGAGNWGFSHRLEGFTAPSLYVEPDAKGRVWVSHAYKGLYRLDLSPDLKKVQTVRTFDKSQGLPGNFNTNIFNLEGQIVFSSDAGFYLYDEISNRFSPYRLLNTRLGSFASSNKIIRAGEKKYWFINHGRIGLVDLSVPGKVGLDASSFSLLNGRMVEFYESISRISPSLYVISVDDGFVFYNARTRPPRNRELPRVLIRRVVNTTGKLVTLTESSTKNLEVPYGQNNLEISFTLPYYRQGGVRYRYFLEGHSRQWSEWSSRAQQGFTNLEPGQYRFLVKARVNEGAQSPVTVFTFTVLPPWYQTRWAWLLYGG